MTDMAESRKLSTNEHALVILWERKTKKKLQILFNVVSEYYDSKRFKLKYGWGVCGCRGTAGFYYWRRLPVYMGMARDTMWKESHKGVEKVH